MVRVNYRVHHLSILTVSDPGLPEYGLMSLMWTVENDFDTGPFNPNRLYQFTLTLIESVNDEMHNHATVFYFFLFKQYFISKNGLDSRLTSLL